jgi:hypothetical protein
MTADLQQCCREIDRGNWAEPIGAIYDWTNTHENHSNVFGVANWGGVHEQAVNHCFSASNHNPTNDYRTTNHRRHTNDDHCHNDYNEHDNSGFSGSKSGLRPAGSPPDESIC